MSDAIDVISGGVKPENAMPKMKKGKVLVRMLGASGSWRTKSGVTFTTEAPFQLLDPGEAYELIAQGNGRFSEGTEEQVKEFYGV